MIKVYGNVQGVFFRTHTKEKADSLGITGWVKNESDGSVTVCAEGKEEDLQKLIEWCKKGTTISRIDHMETKRSEASGQYKDFDIA